jgi:hypothetical protein
MAASYHNAPPERDAPQRRKLLRQAHIELCRLFLELEPDRRQAG